MLNADQVAILMFGFGLFLGIYLGYIAGVNDAKRTARNQTK